jgi:hypothetical protein
MTLLEKFKELLAISTPAPWMVGGKFTVRTTLNSLDWIARTRDRHHKHDDVEDEANAKLITLCRNHIAELLAVVEAAKDWRDSERDLHLTGEVLDAARKAKLLFDALSKLEGELSNE